MIQLTALPFIVQRQNSVQTGVEYTSTRERIFGLLLISGSNLRIQWRATLEVNRYGQEIRKDEEMKPLREVSIPLAEIAGAQVRRKWLRWPPAHALVITAADLKTFEPLLSENGDPGLVLQHPAEMVLEIRRVDRQRAYDLARALNLAVTEKLLASYEEGKSPD